MADNTAVYTGTGRRKEAVARVRLVPGTGKVTVNGRDASEYFGRQQLVDNAVAPFRVTDTVDRFDVLANCKGGGITGQSGALRLGKGLRQLLPACGQFPVLLLQLLAGLLLARGVQLRQTAEHGDARFRFQNRGESSAQGGGALVEHHARKSAVLPEISQAALASSTTSTYCM